MTASFSESLRIYNTIQFKESVSEPASNRLYFTFGKSNPWPNDAAPPIANTSVLAFNEIYKTMIGAKLINGSDISHVIPRHNWSSNTVYYAYDHEMDKANTNNKFYVVTSEYNVYKCIANNNGANSTTMPTSVATTGSVTTVDGYSWKYMYTVPTSERLRYTTNDYIPVKTLTVDDNTLQWDVQQSAIPGAIESIVVIDGGMNYTDANTISLSIDGDGDNANAYAQINTVSNTISTIVIDDVGRNYTYATVSITAGSGTGASLKAIISPQGGHGSDALDELNGCYLLLNPRLENVDEGNKFPIVNEYREVALIRDPYLYGSTTIASNTTIQQYTTITVNGVSVDYNEDEIVYQGSSVSNFTFKGRVLEWQSANSSLKLIEVEGTPSTDILTGVESGANRFVDSVTNPELEPRTGKLLYVDYMTPVSRAADQTEDYKIILHF